MKFLARALVRLGMVGEERERGLRILLPDIQIAGRDRQPAERVHVASRLGNPANPVPGDFIKRNLLDCHSVPPIASPQMPSARGADRQKLIPQWGRLGAAMRKQDDHNTAVACRQSFLKVREQVPWCL